MNLFGSALRSIALAGVLASASVVPAFVAPAYAGPAEVSLLKTYLGTWKGTGKMTGAQAQDVTCRLSLTSGNQDKVNYTGRCGVAGQQISITGTIAYVETSKRYEAVMNSGIGGFRGAAVGQKKGDSIVFDLKQRSNDDEGNDISIASTVILKGTNIAVSFHATFNKSGDTMDATVPFKKV
jgi:hypothetical protein